MYRRPSTQDITWLLDLHANKQLDLEPPYQRRSVWTLKDKQFFLDTILRNYPSPAIFLHKTINEIGKATYHVVDGKQRTQTILDFVNDKIKISKSFGDARFAGKKWSELSYNEEQKQIVWNYQLTVELIDASEGSVVNEVFDRLNRNSRRLTAQELRHAKYEGWLISQVELESTREEWSNLGIVTKARVKRMVDCQFLSELMLVVLERSILGFDQEELDSLYAKYEDPVETAPDVNLDEAIEKFAATKNYLLDMERHNQVITQYARGFGNFYTLWSLVALTDKRPSPDVLSERYVAFQHKVETLKAQSDLPAFLQSPDGANYSRALTYLNNSQGASTERAQRQGRLDALRAAVMEG